MGKTDLVALERALIFLCLLMYHRRDVEEADELREKMVGAQPVRLREEVREVGKTAIRTIYDEGLMEGRREEAVRARQETLLALLAEKFGPVPPKVVEHVRALQDTEALDVLLKRFAHAEHLDDMGL